MDNLTPAKLNKGFVDMLSAKNNDLPTFYGKMMGLYDSLEKFYEALHLVGMLFSESVISSFAQVYLDELRALEFIRFDKDILGGYDFSSLDSETARELGVKYRKINDKLLKGEACAFVTAFLQANREIERHYMNKSEAIPGAKPDKAISSIAGQIFCPFSDVLSTVDIFQQWLKNKSVFHSCLQKLFVVGRQVYEAMIVPDIDPRHIHDIIIHAFERDDLKRKFGKASKVINMSTSTLVDNFPQYYEAYIRSGDPSVMLTSYIEDINSNATTPDVQLELKKVFEHYNGIITKSRGQGFKF